MIARDGETTLPRKPVMSPPQIMLFSVSIAALSALGCGSGQAPRGGVSKILPDVPTAPGDALSSESAADEKVEDRDGDAVADLEDNCPDHPNPAQADADDDGEGDACDRSDDEDLDGLVDGKDNCPAVVNPDQRDQDRDGRGDICDEDLDGDKVENDLDNCPLKRNPKQKDRNGNSIGDRCERAECLANDCGGCAELSVVVGDRCGACETGQWVCTSLETVECRCR
jgi:hypothetical protein